MRVITEGELGVDEGIADCVYLPGSPPHLLAEVILLGLGHLGPSSAGLPLQRGLPRVP